MPLTDSRPAARRSPINGVVRLRAKDDDCLERAPSSHCRGGRNEIVPDTKGLVTSGTVLFGSEAVTSELEVVVDPAMGGEETLRVAR